MHFYIKNSPSEHISAVTDANGKTLSYAYDEYDRSSKISYPDGRDVVYNYDKDDNIIKVSDSKGITADFTYDKAGNIVKCVRSDGTETTYSYDKKYNLTKLVNRKGNHIISSYEYSGYIENEDGELKKTSYTYNAAGNRVSITRGGDEGTIRVTYNRDNQVVSEENSKTGDKIKYVYDENGNLIEKKSKGSTIIYEYDIENRLRSVSQGGQMLMAATYDGLGNKVFQMSRKFVERDVSKDEGDSEGDDDEEGEISGSWFDPDMFMYGFMQGGMKMSTSQSPSLMAAVGNKLSEIWEGITTFFTGDFKTVDIEELEGIIVPGTERGTFITYDLTYYLNDTNFNEYSQVMYQYGSDGDDKASYVYGAYDERISADLTSAAVAYVNDRAGSYTYLYDGQGNVTQNLLNGKEANSYYYDPFGKVEDGVEDNDVIFGYNGEEYTEASQLQYLRQRHYAPDMGAFLTQDAYRGDLYEPISQNRYTYAGNDPVNYNDPGGDRRNNRSVANKTQMGGSNRRGADKQKTIGAANNALSQALNIGKNLTGSALTALTNWANAAAPTQQGRKSGDGTQQTYRQEQVRSSTEIIKDKYKGLAEKLQSGVDKGNPPNNASPWGTREPAGKRREYTVPMEERPGVWAFGLELGGMTDIVSGYINPQIVFRCKGRKSALCFDVDGGKLGGGATLNFVNTDNIVVYTDGIPQSIGFSSRNVSLSLTRYLYKDEYYYGYSMGIGYYTAGLNMSTGIDLETIIMEIVEGYK